VTAYFNAVAREVRELLGEMGFSSLEEIIGRADLLTFALSENSPAERKIVLDRFFSPYPEGTEKIRIKERNDNPAQSMNDMLVHELLPFIEKEEPVQKTYEIRNVNRSVPAKLNYHIALCYRDEGLPADTVRLIFKGTAGQSFGAFNHKGLSLTLFGEANDYVGKGMFGGKIIIRPGHTGYCRDCVVMGNTALYGATGGEFYAAGKAGERFAVRNSGVTAVVEGTGHHLCEYMTRGTVVVIGETGYNIGAGMTGGIIYIYDEHDKLNGRLNGSYVTATGLDEKDATSIKSLLEHHYSCTESHRAGAILERFDAALKRFKKITPINNFSPS
jgi:glutamate synthase (NADPH/NADH) large chain